MRRLSCACRVLPVLNGFPCRRRYVRRPGTDPGAHVITRVITTGEPPASLPDGSGRSGYRAPVTSSSHVDLGSRVDALLARSHAKALVAAYFDPEAGFAGELFDTLGESDPYAVVRDDLLAVSLLEVRFGPAAVRAVLGPRAAEISALLRAVDPEEPIWSERGGELLDGPLSGLWRLLCGLPGVGPVTATKLLARKRPHLAPIVDRVILRALGSAAGGSWRAVRAVLLDGERRARLAELRPGGCVTVLRLLDVLLWMHGSESRAVRRVRARLGADG
jgi:hypothetical protein